MNEIKPFVEYVVEKQGWAYALVRKSHVSSQVLDVYSTRTAADAAKRKLEKSLRKKRKK